VFYTRHICQNLGDDFKPEMVAGHSLGEFQLWLQMELYHLKMD
jgi:malonyl CoA-acyl carrier protein transacylase